jgi:hypothetical protein
VGAQHKRPEASGKSGPAHVAKVPQEHEGDAEAGESVLGDGSRHRLTTVTAARMSILCEFDTHPEALLAKETPRRLRRWFGVLRAGKVRGIEGKLGFQVAANLLSY